MCAWLSKLASIVGVEPGEIRPLDISEGDALRERGIPDDARVGWVGEIEALGVLAASVASAAGGVPAALFLSTHDELGGLVLPAERWCAAAHQLLQLDGDGVIVRSLDGRCGFVVDIIDPTPFERMNRPEVQRFEWRVWGDAWVPACGTV